MKKLFMILLAALFLMSLTVTAFAKVELSGDARFRGMNTDNYNLNDKIDYDDRWMEYRTRLKLHGENADGTWGIKARITVLEKCAGGDAGASGADPGDSSSIASCTVSSNNIVESGDDYAYIWGKVNGYKLFIGKQHANWGHKFQIWENSKDRIKIVKKFGDTVVGAYWDKLVEERNDDTSIPADGMSDLDDKNNYAVLVKHDFGNGNNAGLKIDIQDDERDATTTTTTTGAGADGLDGTTDDVTVTTTTAIANDSGWKAAAFVNWNVNGIKIEGDLAVDRGDMWEKKVGHGLDWKMDEGDPIGGALSASTTLNSIMVKGLVAFTQDGWKADDDFKPTALIGTDSPIALVGDFGEFGGKGGPRVDTFLAVAEASKKINPDLTIGGRLAYMTFDAYTGIAGLEQIYAGGPKDGSAVEIDLGLSYNVASNVTYSIEGAVFIPDDLSVEDDNAYGLINALVVKF